MKETYIDNKKIPKGAIIQTYSIKYLSYEIPKQTRHDVNVDLLTFKLSDNNFDI